MAYGLGFIPDIEFLRDTFAVFVLAAGGMTGTKITLFGIVTDRLRAVQWQTSPPVTALVRLAVLRFIALIYTSAAITFLGTLAVAPFARHINAQPGSADLGIITICNGVTRFGSFGKLLRLIEQPAAPKAQYHCAQQTNYPNPEIL